MRKTFTLIFITLCILLSSTTAFAAEGNKSISTITDSANKILTDYISSTANLKSPESFKSIIDCCEKAAYNNISSYMNFVYQNRFNFSQLQIINRILGNGTTIQSLEQAYEFWMTTDKDFEFIEQMCLLENNFVSEYWYECAFDVLTDYEHGVLEGAEILEYLNKGISADEITAANVMSKKEGQNIKTILDQVLEGITLEEQAKTLYNYQILPECNSMTEVVTTLAKESKNPVLYQKNTKADLQKIIQDKIKDSAEKLKITLPNRNYEDEVELYQNAAYPYNVQKALFNKGYTAEEIQKSAEIFEKDIFTSVKKAREIMKNEE